MSKKPLYDSSTLFAGGSLFEVMVHQQKNGRFLFRNLSNITLSNYPGRLHFQGRLQEHRIQVEKKIEGMKLSSKKYSQNNEQMKIIYL
jgi:hypothetical protein